MIIQFHPKVEKVLKTLTQKERARIDKIADLFKIYRFSVDPIYLKKITGEIWEFKAGRYRLLFGVKEEAAHVVNIFLKQTQKTPIKEIELSIRRFKNI